MNQGGSALAGAIFLLAIVMVIAPATTGLIKRGRNRSVLIGQNPFVGQNPFERA